MFFNSLHSLPPHISLSLSLYPSLSLSLYLSLSLFLCLSLPLPLFLISFLSFLSLFSSLFLSLSPSLSIYLFLSSLLFLFIPYKNLFSVPDSPVINVKCSTLSSSSLALSWSPPLEVVFYCGRRSFSCMSFCLYITWSEIPLLVLNFFTVWVHSNPCAIKTC